MSLLLASAIQEAQCPARHLPCPARAGSLSRSSALSWHWIFFIGAGLIAAAFVVAFTILRQPEGVAQSATRSPQADRTPLHR